MSAFPSAVLSAPRTPTTRLTEYPHYTSLLHYTSLRAATFSTSIYYCGTGYARSCSLTFALPVRLDLDKACWWVMVHGWRCSASAVQHWTRRQMTSVSGPPSPCNSAAGSQLTSGRSASTVRLPSLHCVLSSNTYPLKYRASTLQSPKD